MTGVGRDWDAFLKSDIGDKLPFFSREGRLYDCLFSQQFDRTLLDHLFSVANRLRKLTKTKKGADFTASLLSHKRAMLYFVQPSTRRRTFLALRPLSTPFKVLLSRAGLISESLRTQCFSHTPPPWSKRRGLSPRASNTTPADCASCGIRAQTSGC